MILPHPVGFPHHIVAVYRRPPPGGPQEGRQYLQRRALPGPVGTYGTEDLPLVDGKAYPPKGLNLSVFLFKVRNLDDGHGYLPTPIVLSSYNLPPQSF